MQIHCGCEMCKLFIFTFAICVFVLQGNICIAKKMSFFHVNYMSYMLIICFVTVVYTSFVPDEVGVYNL